MCWLAQSAVVLLMNWYCQFCFIGASRTLISGVTIALRENGKWVGWRRLMSLVCCMAIWLTSICVETSYLSVFLGTF